MSRFVKVAVLLVPLIWLGAWGGNAYAANCTSIAATAWNLQTTWGAAGVGCVGAPGGIPGAADTATIATNVTLDANRSVTNLTVALGDTLNLNSNNLTISGNITINGTVNDPNAGAAGILQSTGNAAVVSGSGGFTGEARLYFAGTAPSIAAGSTLNFAGTTQIRAGRNGGATVAASVLTINGTITSTQAAGTTLLGLYGNSTIISATGVIDAAPAQITYATAAATLTNNGSVTIQNVVGNAGTSVWTNAANSTLNVSGALMATGVLNANAAGNTVNYTGAAQTVDTPSGAPATYYNLILSGSGAKTMPGVAMTVAGYMTTSGTATATTAANLTINDNLDVGAGTTLTVAGFNIAVTGTTSVSGTLAHSSNVGTKTYTGLVTVNAGGSWTNAGNAAITFGGGLTDNGSFAWGTGVQTVSGGDITYAGTAWTTGTGSFTFSGGGQNIICDGTHAFTIPTLTVNNTVTNNCTGGLTVSTALAGTSTLTQGANSILNIGFIGPPGIATLNATSIGNTVNYNRAGNQTIEPTSYYDLNLSTSGIKTMTNVTAIGGDLTISGTATMTGNAAFTVAGALNYTSTGATTLTAARPISIGTFNQTAGTLIDNGNTITVTGTGANTWTKAGGTFTATGTVIFTGAAPQIGASNFNNLTINVGGGNTATLTGNAIVNNVLSLANGVVTTGANVLDVTSSCATAGIITRTNGYVFGNLSLHYPAGAASCTFPVGDAAYTPVTVAMANVTSGLANSILTARADRNDHPDTLALLSGIDPGKSVNCYWTLTQGASLTFTGTYNATFTYNGNYDAGATTANFLVGRKSGGVWTYPTVGAANNNFTTATGMSGFGEFAIGQRAMPSITVLKAVTAVFDPVNNTTNPKAIPGAEMLYTVTVTNFGPGPADANTTVITDSVPANTIMCVSTTCSSPVMTFTCSATPACGLTFSYPASVTYSCSSLPCPQADANGYGTNVTSITINPSGTFNGALSPQSTNFSVSFKVKIN